MSAIEYVKTLKLGDGDVVIMRVLHTPSIAQLESYRDQLRQALDGKRVLMLGEALEVDAIKPSTVDVLERVFQRAIAAGSLNVDEQRELSTLVEALRPDDPDRHDQPF